MRSLWGLGERPPRTAGSTWETELGEGLARSDAEKRGQPGQWWWGGCGYREEGRKVSPQDFWGGREGRL